MNLRRHSLSRYIISSADPSTHFKMARGEVQPGFERLPCLLARAWADGTFEMVNPAWHRLGYSDEELAGRCVADFIALEPDAARGEFALCCKDGREVKFHGNRRSTISRAPCLSSGTGCPELEARSRLASSRSRSARKA